MAASTLAGAITFTGCAVMPSVTAFADTTEQTGQVSYDNEVMPIHTDVQTEAKPLMKGTSCTVSDGKNLYYAFEMMGVRMGIMKYNTKTGKKSEVYSGKLWGTIRMPVQTVQICFVNLPSQPPDQKQLYLFLCISFFRQFRHQENFLRYI